MWPASRSRAPLPARSGDAALLRLLRHGAVHGVVHSVFERVVNVQRSDGELFTLATRDLDDAPNTLVLQAPSFAGSGIAPGDAVEALEGRLDVGEWIEIRLDAAMPWHGRLPDYPADDSALRANLALLRQLTASRRLGASADASTSVLAAATAALLQRQGRLLGSALRRRDMASACTLARTLVGLGPGLTPSGDDFLVGLLAVLQLPRGSPEDFASLGPAVCTGLAHRTNVISAAALRSAAQGQVRESLQALIAVLVAGERAALEPALVRVLAIGSTSGADMVAGIACGLEVRLQAVELAPCR